MSNLTKPFDIVSSPGEVLSIALSNVEIFRGGAVGIAKGTGYGVVFNPATAGMIFAGIALESVDNSGGSAGDKRIKVQRRGLFEFNQSGLAITDIGKAAYLSDDNTITLTPNLLALGPIVALDPVSGKALVDIGPAASGNGDVISGQPWGTLASAGNAQGNAGAIVAKKTNVSGADGTKGVILPASADIGDTFLVYNSVATNGLPIYPPSSGTINGGSANAAVTIEGKTLAMFQKESATNWVAMYTANT